MKYWLLSLALPLFAQFPERELALGSALRKEILKESTLIEQPVATNYLREVIQSFAGSIKFDLIEANAEDPMALPGGYLLIPANSLRNAKSETQFRSAIAHAIAHIELRHGVKGQIFMGGWSGVHPDPSRRNSTPMGFRKDQERFEQEANEFAAAKVIAQPDSAAFLAAKKSLQP
jgi:Zn-dependent protease with chaperone function